MARTKIDQQRHRKIYPMMKSAPRYFQQSNEVETHLVSFSSESSKTIGIGTYTYPVVVLTSEDSVNAWISSLVQPNHGSSWQLTINTSSAYTGKIHVHVAEANS